MLIWWGWVGWGYLLRRYLSWSALIERRGIAKEAIDRVLVDDMFVMDVDRLITSRVDSECKVECGWKLSSVFLQFGR